MAVPIFPAAGDFFIRLHISDDIFMTTGDFKVAPPCAYVECGIHGKCDGGECICTGGYSGSGCDVAPCNNDECMNEAPCVVDATSPTGKCVCDGLGFSGSTCSVPISCDITAFGCENGGEPDKDCAKCECAGRWGGNKCETCGIKCNTDSGPNTGCTACLDDTVPFCMNFPKLNTLNQPLAEQLFKDDIEYAGFQGTAYKFTCTKNIDADVGTLNCENCFSIITKVGTEVTRRRLLATDDDASTKFVSDSKDDHSDLKNGIVTVLAFYNSAPSTLHNPEQTPSIRHHTHATHKHHR